MLLLLMVLFPSRASAQSPPPETNNSVFLELLGSGGAYSANYERRLGPVRARIGFGTWTAEPLFGGPETSLVTVPVTVQGVLGRRAHRFEIGGGLLFGKRDRTAAFGESNGFVSVSGIVGYRYQRPAGRFLFRAVATPFYGFGEEDVAYPDKGFLPSLGISFGFAF